MGGINGIQLLKVGSEESQSSGPEMPVNPGRGISQLASSNNDSPPPADGPHSREPEASTDIQRGISQLPPWGNSSSVRTYRPLPRKPESPPSPQHDIPRSPNTTSTMSSYRPPPRHPIRPMGRSPPPSLLDAPIPSSLSPGSLDILLPTHRDTLQLSQLSNSPTLGNYRPPPPRPVPAPRYSPSEAPSSSPEPRGMTTPTLTHETQLTFATPPLQAQSQSLQPFPTPQGISQLSPSLQPPPGARHRTTSSSFPRHIPWTTPHQKPPHEILDSLCPAVLPLITALVDSRRSHVIPLHNLRICLENHFCVPNLIDLKWDPAAPLGSSSVKELQSGINKMLKGFSVILNLKLRVEMGGERGTKTMLRVLMNEDGESSSGDVWLATEGAGWEDLERIEAGIMFPQETQAG